MALAKKRKRRELVNFTASHLPTNAFQGWTDTMLLPLFQRSMLFPSKQ